MPLLQVSRLHTAIQLADKVVYAVKDVSFQVQHGETFALVGESGSGKSITALSITRLLPDAAKITQGEVLLNGQNLLACSERQMRAVRGRKIAMIFQEPMTSLNPVINIGDQIIESMRQHEKLPKRAARERCLEILQAVGLPNARRNMDEYPHQLSGGMRQRIMIAIALAAHPEVLIADEPTTALDVTIQAQVLELLRALQEQFSMGLIFITHDLGVVQQMADRVAVMRAGELLESAVSKEFFAAPQQRYSQQLLDAIPAMEKRGQRLLADNATPIQAGPPAAEGINESSQPVLEVENLHVYFPIRKGIFKRVVDHVKAVRGVSLQLYAGKTLALVGESGCGKTTVGKAVLRLLDATGGSIFFQGSNLLELSSEQLRVRRNNLQIVFQDPYSSLNPRMLAGDIIEEGMVSLGVGENAVQRRLSVARLLDQVGLPKDAVHRYPHEFSGGQRQRICIARALAVRPQVIICDEPTSALDVSVQAQVLNLIQDLQAEFGVSYLFITHDMSVVSYLANEVAVMYQGKIVETGEALSVLRHPQHEYTKKLLAAVPRLHLH